MAQVKYTQLMKIIYAIKNDPVRRECGRVIKEMDFSKAIAQVKEIIETEIKYLRLALEDLEELES